MCGFLDKEKIDYVMVGGMVVNFHGLPRTTMDVDLILQIEEKNILKLVEFLKRNDFFASTGDLNAALREKSHCTVQDKKSMFRLDIKGVYNEMDKRTFKNRKSFRYKGTKIYIASAEDTIANKLVFGSEQDLKDAEGIFIRQLGKLDMKYLERICVEMGVGKELAGLKRAAREASGSRGRRRF
ncbi:MAG: DUF6036 family nucleotidyltransferase [Candidatus Hadarchaeota archaeon]